MLNEEIEINECNEKCKGCYYFKEASLFCNYPFKEQKIGFNFGMDIGTHECTAYGNKFHKPKTTVMTQEEKDLLLKDLCSRLPYGVKISVSEYNFVTTLVGIPSSNTILFHNEDNYCVIEECFVWKIKPYLRPMSSMTDEEKWEHYRLKEHSDWQAQDYLDSIHVDYRGLIWKGLALEAPEGMYKNVPTSKTVMSWEYYPKEFSSYEEYVKYLKEKGFALEAP